MRVNLDCVPCMLQQALKTARLATDDMRLHELVLKKTAELLAEVDYANTPPELAHRVHGIVREITGNPDPYKKIKEHDNRLALRLYPGMKKIVSDSDNPLYTAVKLAVAGNIVDYGVNHVFDLKETLGEVRVKDFARNMFPDFERELRNAQHIMYLADNAGELVFDRLLIEEFRDKDVTLVVKGAPIINDATLEDVKQVGLSDLVEVDFIGNGVPGTGSERTDPSFLKTPIFRPCFKQGPGQL